MSSFKIDRRRALGASLSSLLLAKSTSAADVTLLNVSYDPTRELYREVDPAFSKVWQAKSHDHLTINQSHGGSGAQSRAVLEGLPADVVTLALAADIDVLAKHGLVAKNWQSRLPHNSCPYTSTIVFLVRKGNPRHIKDWPDLIRPDVSVITPNPKTSGGARWNFLAALAWAQRQPGAAAASAQEYLRKLFHHVPVLNTGARGATNSFVQRDLGDVLIAWENEAWLALNEFGPDAYQIVYPSLSVLAEPPVAVVDSVVERRHTRAPATAYLEFLYTPQGQRIIGKHFYRPREAKVAAEFASRYPPLKMVTIADFGGWDAVQAKYFADGGVFDQIFTPGR